MQIMGLQSFKKLLDYYQPQNSLTLNDTYYCDKFMEKVILCITIISIYCQVPTSEGPSQ